MDELNMLIEPLFALGTEIGIVLELFDLSLFTLEFNNIQLLVKGEVINKLFDE